MRKSLEQLEETGSIASHQVVFKLTEIVNVFSLKGHDDLLYIIFLGSRHSRLGARGLMKGELGKCMRTVELWQKI